MAQISIDKLKHAIDSINSVIKTLMKTKKSKEKMKDGIILESKKKLDFIDLQIKDIEKEQLRLKKEKMSIAEDLKKIR